MATKHAQRRSPKAKRRVDVDISVNVLPGFLGKLARATGGSADYHQLIGEDGTARGGSVQKNATSLDAGQFAIDYLWRELLSKYDDRRSSAGKAATAIAKFRDAEVQCGITNSTLSRMVGLPNDLAVTDIERAMFVARRKVRDILGRFDWNHVARGFEFTSGASTRLPRTRSSVPHKYSGTPETTRCNADLAWAAIMSKAPWRHGLGSSEGPINLRLVDGNRVTTVPKNYKTDRLIAIEPDMNMYVQKGLGNLIRERLRRVGIDLNSQSTNQDMALYGSRTGSYATIDLSMASDTVSLELVRWLLPPVWCEALEQCRSIGGVLPSGERVLYRKFSSMGNGYTFELESMIFYALTFAACQLTGAEAHLVTVYGDDIIVPTKAAPFLCELLKFAGFTPNEDKTFLSGPFRESCGKHYFNGIDVQPFYIKEPVVVLTDLFKLHNKLYRWQKRQAGNALVDHDKIDQLRAWLRSFAPSSWRKPRIPDGFGDGAFIGTFDECTPRVADTYRPGKLGKRDGWSGYLAEVIVMQPTTCDLHEDGYGSYRIRNGLTEFVPAPFPVEVVGRLMQSLAGVGRSNTTIFSTPFEGGVERPPRPRCCKIIVDGFA